MHFIIKKGLDIPIGGTPRQSPPEPSLSLREEVSGDCWSMVEHVALVAEDYPGLRPSMKVREGEGVAAGQLLLVDKKNPAVKFTAPASGEVVAVNRGERRRFLSLVIRVREGEGLYFPVEEVRFGSGSGAGGSGQEGTEDGERVGRIKEILLDSGLWTALRTRPYGKVANPEEQPSALFVTAIDTRPLAPDPRVIMALNPEDFRLGLQVAASLAPITWLSLPGGEGGGHGPAGAGGHRQGREEEDWLLPFERPPGLKIARFSGPHPAGLPSTHIHLLHPVGPGKLVWQLDYQDVLAMGHLFRTGHLSQEKIISLAGPGVKDPRLIRVRPGSAIDELLEGELVDPSPKMKDSGQAQLHLFTDDNRSSRVISGSVLDGRRAQGPLAYLGRYHHQISLLPEDDGSSLFGWLTPGANRFSLVPAFLSALKGFRPAAGFNFNTATWGGRRAIYPLGTYERVMPLDIIATALLKAIASGNSERAVELGALELVEEDLALCSFVCPGKNDFGPMLRELLTRIEEEG